MPIAAWEFNGDLKDAIGSLDLKAHGKISYNGGAVVLKNSYLQSNGLPFELKAKTLEVFCTIQNIDMKGGGLMGIQGPGDFFDTIVIGERKDRHWISGSNGFARTNDFPGSFPEQKAGPIRSTICIVLTILGSLIGYLVILFRDLNKSRKFFS